MSMFAEATKKAASARFKQPQLDAEGQQIEYDVREDEEQNVKLRESIDLLLAAGYFRARIKGLTPFDKIVGGMTWCLQLANFDIDVDLLFQENSTIGQKIALTEKIVAVLPRMKCPHRLEPHQIQGLDFIHIYPVIQWLVKLAIATREEMGDFIRAFSESQFNKDHMTPEDSDFEFKIEKAVSSLEMVKMYKPQRRYRRPVNVMEETEETQVYTTLLEYGRRYGHGRTIKASKEDSKEIKKRQLSSKLVSGREKEEMDTGVEEERRIKALMKDMAETEGGDMFVSTAAVGSIVSLQSNQIKQMASEYAEKSADLAAGRKPDKVLVAQAHQRRVAALEKQITTQERKIQYAQARHDELQLEYNQSQARLDEVETYGERIAEEMAKLNAMETAENRGVVQELRGLVTMNENLKKQELLFKMHCKEEKGRLEEAIARLIMEEELVGEEVGGERMDAIRLAFQTDKDKLTKIRALLARKNREIALLQRKIDEVPSRTELSQYQRRFIELYKQVGATLTETRQFYTLYNTLEDQKAYMEKEAGILNNIHDNFDMAMSSDKNKELFLRQVEQILEGVCQDRVKLEQKRSDERTERDRLNIIYLELVEEQRTYYKSVRDFQEECRKNEILLSKLKVKGARA